MPTWQDTDRYTEGGILNGDYAPLGASLPTVPSTPIMTSATPGSLPKTASVPNFTAKSYVFSATVPTSMYSTPDLEPLLDT